MRAHDGGWRRSLGLAALVTYTGFLVLAALPPEVRPRPLERAGESARALLASFGIRPGVAVFESSRQPVSRIVLNDCIRVRGLVEGRPPELLQPRDGRCFTRGLRPRMPWREYAVRSLLLRPPPPLDHALLGDGFCHAGRPEASFDAVEIVWSQPWRELGGDASGLSHAALLVWRCEPPGLTRRSLRPDAAEILRLPPGPLPAAP